jgi:Sec-independent protein secretion pathway component TatC
MALMFVAMAILYEISLLLSRIVLSKRIKTLAEQATAEDEDGEDSKDGEVGKDDA